MPKHLKCMTISTMILNSLVLLSLFAGCSYGYETCDDAKPPLSNSVSNCTDNDKSCILHKNTTVTIQITFSGVNSEKVTTQVYGIVQPLPIPLPFPMPNSDACKDSGISCPIQQGKTYIYHSSIFVSNDFPRVSVTVKWVLVGDNGDIVCLLIPAKIK